MTWIMGHSRGPTCPRCGRKVRQSQRVDRDDQGRTVHAYRADCPTTSTDWTAMTSSTAPLTFRISGVAMSTIEGSDLYQRPEVYTRFTDPDHEAALEAGSALQSCEVRRSGKGWTHVVTCSPAAAAIVRDYCDTVGESFAAESEPDIRAEGRALLVVRDRLDELLGR